VDPHMAPGRRSAGGCHGTEATEVVLIAMRRSWWWSCQPG
jgi:hypothetical protein